MVKKKRQKNKLSSSKQPGRPMQNYTMLDDERGSIALPNSESTEEELFFYLLACREVIRPPPRAKICLATLTDNELLTLCRFSSRDIDEISQLLQLPSDFQTISRYRLSRHEGLFLLCTFLAAPTPLDTLSILLGYPKSVISEGINWMMEYLFKHWDFLLQDFSSGQLTPDRLALFARKVCEHGAPLERCVGFIDCTIRGICRPSQ